MDLSKFEKIDGGLPEALAYMKKSKLAYTEDGYKYTVDASNKLFIFDKNHGLVLCVERYNNLVQKTWLKKKPFDVRQAMRDKPDEWVGVFQENGDCYKIGFDNESYQAVHTLLSNDIKPDLESINVYPCEKEHLIKSISIDDERVARFQ